MLFMSCVGHAFASVHCCLVVTCWERTWLLFVVSNCDFVTFHCGIPGQVWYLIVLIPDLAVFHTLNKELVNVHFETTKDNARSKNRMHQSSVSLHLCFVSVTYNL